METELMVAIIGMVMAVINPCVSWRLAKKKYNTEVDGGVIENMENVLDFYTKLSDDNKNRLDELSDIKKKLEQEVLELRRLVFNLSMNICLDLTCKNRQYQKEDA